MKTFRNLVCLTLMAAVACSAVADEKEKKGKGKKPTATQRFVAKMELTDEQKTLVAAIDKQFAEKFDAGRKTMDEILTDDQKKAQRAAQKAAKEAGTKPQDARKEVEAALNLTDEQKAERKTAQADQKKLDVEVVAALKKVLTAEQQEKLPKQGAEKGKRKKKNAA
jgi:Spy/CpxP family protein refolding chaperone